MSVRDNPRYLKHLDLISEALKGLPDDLRATGQRLLLSMQASAEELDATLEPQDQFELGVGGAVILKREQFHSRCKEMGAWLQQNCPDVILD